MLIAIDTNLLVYAEGNGETAADQAKREIIWPLIGQLLEGDHTLLVSAQVLIELHDILVRKRKLNRAEAMERINAWRAMFDVISTSDKVLESALSLSARHNFRIFDCVIVAAAADARCDQLLSEDMQHGFVWRGVEVVNPFLPP